MSLVNDMLNDLDQRRSKQGPAPQALEWMAGQTPVRPQRSYMALLAIIFIAVMLGLGYFLLGPLTGYGSDSADRLLTLVPRGGAVSDPAVETSAVAAQLPAAAGHTVSSEPPLAGAQLAPTPAPAVKHPSPTGQQHRQLITPVPAAPNAVAGAGEVAVAAPTTTVIKVTSTAPHSSDNSADADVVVAAKIAAASGPIKTSRPRSFEQRDKDAASEGRALIRQRSLARAEIVLRQQLLTQPGSPASAVLLASVLLSQKHYAQVASLLLQQRAVNPRNIGLLQIEARLLLSTDKAEQALELLLSRQPAVTQYSAYYELLALAARQNKRFELASGSYRQLLVSDPARGDWWVGLAIVLDEQALPAQALKAYSRGLKTQRIGTDLAAYARRRVASISTLNQ